MAKGLKLKVRKFLGLIPTFLEVTGEKPIGWSRMCVRKRVISSLVEFHHIIKKHFPDGGVPVFQISITSEAGIKLK